jgi:hypothetical protein
MFRIDHPRSRLARSWALTFLFTAAALLAGCATHYVDGATKEVPVAQFARIAPPRPVQLLTEFQTKGIANARATGLSRPMIADSVRASGLFSELGDTPPPGGGVLTVTVNNVPLTDDAAAKGFIAGLTFGAAGQQVTDGYVCTVSYLPAGGAKPILKSARHAIHTTIGASAAPPDSYKASNMEDAFRTMLRQILSVALNELSHDPDFK